MITALVSKKGGVGKTTTSVNLAAALAGIGKRVLLMDLDSQASASLSLGFDRASLPPSVADVLRGSIPLLRAVRRTRTPGLDMVTASADLASFDSTMASHPQRELMLRSHLEPASRLYDFVLLDCPSSMSLLPLNALVAADSYMVPIVPHYLAVESIRNLQPTARRLDLRFGHPTALLGIVLTIVDYRTRANRENVDRIRRQFGRDVFAVEIRTNIRLAEAPAEGRTIFEYDASSSGAKAYRLLAAELLIRAAQLLRGNGRPTATPAPAASRSASGPSAERVSEGRGTGRGSS